MKLESLVIADQHAAVNTFPGLVHTARHITKAGCTRSGDIDSDEINRWLTAMVGAGDERTKRFDSLAKKLLG